jgi:hypothetical protein
MLVVSFIKNGTMPGLFYCQLRGTFCFTKKTGVVFVFLTSFRSFCRLCLCVGCK